MFFTPSAIFRAAVGILFVLAATLSSPTRMATADDPIVEAYLLKGKLTEGEKALTAHLAKNQDDDQARFGLGVLQFCQSIEHLGQSLYRFGLGADDQLADEIIPFLRMPVPVNKKPDQIEIDDVRKLLQTMVDDLDEAEKTLAQVKAKDVKLPLHLLGIRFDFDQDGRSSEEESLKKIFFQYMGGGPIENLPESAAAADRESVSRGQAAATRIQDDMVVAFDYADVLWLRGYCHLLRAMAESILAYDFQPLWDVAAHAIFPNVKNDSLFLKTKRNPEEMFDVGMIMDAVAAIHSMHFKLRDADRLKRAHTHLLEMTRLSRQNWDAIQAETDNDREWIPGSKQVSAVTATAVSEEMIKTWRAFLDEFDALLKGEKLAPFWRGSEPGVGVNLRKIFEDPTDFDLILWIQGSGMKPFLEKGELTSEQTWSRFQRVFGGDFFGFAIWFN